MRRTTILLADDHVMLMDSVANILRQEFDVVGFARDGHSMVKLARTQRPEVIVTDISMPNLNGLDAVRILRKEGNSARFLFLSMHADLPLIAEAFRAGGLGYIVKACPSDELLKAIRSVSTGSAYVTPLIAGDLISTLLTARNIDISRESQLSLRQRQVLQLIAEGRTMKEVAASLEISTRTAESHKYEIMSQLGIRTTAEMIRYAMRIKLV